MEWSKKTMELRFAPYQVTPDDEYHWANTSWRDSDFLQ